MFIYEEHLDKEKFSSQTISHKVLLQIINASDTENTGFKEQWEMVINSARMCVNTRIKTLTYTYPSEVSQSQCKCMKVELNIFTLSLELLAYYMDNQGWNIDWFDCLGFHKDSELRFCDFACYLVYFYSLKVNSYL